MKNSTRVCPALHALMLATLIGCGAADAPDVPDDGLTIQNPHDGIWQDRDVVPIRFELERTFGAEEEPVEAALSFVRQVAVDGEGNLYVHDGYNPDRILSFAPDGTLRWTIEANGQGPGELNAPSGLAWSDGDGLLMLNQRGTRVEAYTSDGALTGSRPLEIEGFWGADLIGTVHPDKLLLTRSTGWLRSDVRMVRNDSTLTPISAIESDQSGGHEAIGFYFGVPVSPFRDHAAVAFLDEYRIELYDSSGTLRRVIMRDMDDLVRPGHATSSDGSIGGMFGRMSRLIELADDYWIVATSWPTNVPDPDQYMLDRLNGVELEPVYAHAIDLYDERDRLLYTVSDTGSTPQVGWPMTIDRAGRLYTVASDPYPQICRYRVIIDEP